MKKAKVTKIDEKTYRFTEAAFSEDVYMYLLIGDEKAMLLDTGYGFTDVAGAIKEITPLPLIVVNTHGHMDHVHGNHNFPFVYLPEEDEECFSRHTNSDFLKNLLRDTLTENHLPLWLMKLPGLHGHVEKVAKAYPSVHKPLPKEGYFELGNRRIEIIKTPGHTLGSICLLDESNNYLFGGDTTCKDGVLLHFPESTDVATFKASIQKLKSLADEGKFNTIFPCHQITPLGTDILDTYLATCDKYLEGKLTDDERKKKKLVYNGTAIQFK